MIRPFISNPPPPRLQALLSEFSNEIFSDGLYESCELVDRYGLELALQLAVDLELAQPLQVWRCPRALNAELGFVPSFEIALTWILGRLAVAGCVDKRSVGGVTEFCVTTPLPVAEVDAVRGKGICQDARNEATFALLDAAVQAYPRVARGEVSAEDALLSAQHVGLWLAYFSNDNPTYAVNNAVTAVALVDEIASRDANVRVLELGAGASSASVAFLEMIERRGLQERIAHFRISEPNAFFRRRGKRLLSKYAQQMPVQHDALDIDQSWQAQGVDEGDYDLVFAVNVLHVAKDLRRSLEFARNALAPQGRLVLGECLRPHDEQPIWAELVFQVLASFIDVELHPTYRPNAGFLTHAQWRAALAASGFADVVVHPNPERIKAVYERFYTGAIVAKA